MRNLLFVLIWSNPFTLINSQDAPVVTAPPAAIGGSGPRPPLVTATAAPGSWKPPASSPGGLPPPSLTGMGRQMRLNGVRDFCLLMPPDPTKENFVDAEADAVAYCTNPVNDTRPMPAGFIKTAHFRNTSKYVQISGTYDPSKMNLSPNDCGGEYDNHGALGVGNPVGAAVDGAHDFMQFIGVICLAKRFNLNEKGSDYSGHAMIFCGLGGCDIPGNAVFCLRACHGPDSYAYCKNTYDLMGCLWVMPGGQLPAPDRHLHPGRAVHAPAHRTPDLLGLRPGHPVDSRCCLPVGSRRAGCRHLSARRESWQQLGCLWRQDRRLAPAYFAGNHSGSPSVDEHLDLGWIGVGAEALKRIRNNSLVETLHRCSL
ncbi:hypothetical protein O181_023670 [Austropuccinia psidii MF-1]|uniref:Uncharacterized protein n=1 Tax=Austropuccinia psidii MF-1 TaxID=1389203 RepID=A0A9Q3GZB4_9BASI|nr:hypothetical protein [Austropuccinia psidii MF-1]